MKLTVLFAKSDEIDFWQFWTKPGSTVLELLLVIGILFAVVLVVFLWVVLLKAPGRKRRLYPKNQVPPGGSSGGSHRRKRRLKLFRAFRRHHRHGRKRRHRRRPVNPTLAQSGGLPPPRPEQPGAH